MSEAFYEDHLKPSDDDDGPMRDRFLKLAKTRGYGKKKVLKKLDGGKASTQASTVSGC